MSVGSTPTAALTFLADIGQWMTAKSCSPSNSTTSGSIRRATRSKLSNNRKGHRPDVSKLPTALERVGANLGMGILRCAPISALLPVEAVDLHPAFQCRVDRISADLGDRGLGRAVKRYRLHDWPVHVSGTGEHLTQLSIATRAWRLGCRRRPNCQLSCPKLVDFQPTKADAHRCPDLPGGCILNLNAVTGQ